MVVKQKQRGANAAKGDRAQGKKSIQVGERIESTGIFPVYESNLCPAYPTSNTNRKKDYGKMRTNKLQHSACRCLTLVPLKALEKLIVK